MKNKTDQSITNIKGKTDIDVSSDKVIAMVFWMYLTGISDSSLKEEINQCTSLNLNDAEIESDSIENNAKSTRIASRKLVIV